MDFKAGQTEAWINPPRGDYQMKLDLVSNKDGQTVLASSPAQKMVLSSSAVH